MSRKLKFRCWHEKENRMIYSFDSGGIEIRELCDFVFGPMGNIAYIAPRLQICDLDGFTMSYTGFVDTDGTEVYEGDILQDTENDIWIVEWSCYSFIARNGSDSLTLNELDGFCVVAGNIYETPLTVES